MRQDEEFGGDIEVEITDADRAAAEAWWTKNEKAFSREAARNAYARMRACERELGEIERVFALQGTRMQEATRVWQQAHPERPGIYPDLGDMLAWFIGERERLLFDEAP